MFGNLFFLLLSSASHKDVWEIVANRMAWHGPSFSQPLSRFGARVVFCMLSCCLRSCVCVPSQPAVSLLVGSRHLLTSGVAHDTSSRRTKTKRLSCDALPDQTLVYERLCWGDGAWCCGASIFQTCQGQSDTKDGDMFPSAVLLVCATHCKTACVLSVHCVLYVPWQISLYPSSNLSVPFFPKPSVLTLIDTSHLAIR